MTVRIDGDDEWRQPDGTVAVSDMIIMPCGNRLEPSAYIPMPVDERRRVVLQMAHHNKHEDGRSEWAMWGRGGSESWDPGL